MRANPIVLLCIMLAACEPDRQQPPAAVSEGPIHDATPASSLPSDVNYTILSDEAMPPHKRSIDVRLNKRVPESVLTTIAHELRSRDARAFERTFIVYYLPDMEVGSGGWATSHFDPDLEVAILGMTPDQEQVLTAEQPSSDREVVGAWMDDRPFMTSRLTIYRSEGQLLLERKYPDGSSGESRLRERATSAGRRFDEVGRTTGDYFLLDQSGELQIRDSSGLIATARKVD